jgi:hypothetical protein
MIGADLLAIDTLHYPPKRPPLRTRAVVAPFNNIADSSGFPPGLLEAQAELHAFLLLSNGNARVFDTVMLVVVAHESLPVAWLNQ